MIYVDTSVALAYLLAEDRQPPDQFWDMGLVSSRLLIYELWTRLHAYEVSVAHRDAARSIIERISLTEMTPNVLGWIGDSMPKELKFRTLDALHLATCIFLISQHQDVILASYDLRMCDAASHMNIPLFDL